MSQHQRMQGLRRNSLQDASPKHSNPLRGGRNIGEHDHLMEAGVGGGKENWEPCNVACQKTSNIAAALTQTAQPSASKEESVMSDLLCWVAFHKICLLIRSRIFWISVVNWAKAKSSLVLNLYPLWRQSPMRSAAFIMLCIGPKVRHECSTYCSHTFLIECMASGYLSRWVLMALMQWMSHMHAMSTGVS